MKKLVFTLFVVIAYSIVTFGAGLSGVKTIPGSYATIALAITDLNANGVLAGGGGVTFNISTPYSETFASPTAGLITATGTAAEPIVFQRTGNGSNPLITAGVGTGGTDAIIKIAGGDYITFDGIDVTESLANTTTTTQMEWGYALVKASSTAPFNGCQYVTIRNCTITLNNTNVTTVGIYSGNHIATNTTNLTLTSTSDAMNNCKFYGNTINKAYVGIYFRGHSSATYYDANNEIGVGGANTITNFGGGSTAAYGIYSMYQSNVKIANNSVTSAAGTNQNVYGMYFTSGSGTVDIFNNTVTVTGGGGTFTIGGFFNALGSVVTANIYSNTVQNCVFTTATTGSFNGITTNGTPTNLNIYSNTIKGNTLSGTGGLSQSTFVGINGNTATNLNIYGNNIYNNTKTGAGGYIYGIQASTSTISLHDNSIYSNTINNTLTTPANSASIYGYYNIGGSASVETYYNNQIYDLNITGNALSNSNGIYGFYTTASNATIPRLTYGNTFRNFTVSGGSGTIYGIYNSGSSNIYKNSVYNLVSSGISGTVYGIYHGSGTTLYLYNNFVSDLKAPDATGLKAVTGINLSGGTNLNAYYNTVFLNCSSTGTTFGTSGLYKSSTSKGDFRNNNIVNLSTPGSSGGYTVAYRLSAAYNASYYLATSNNNNFYAGSPAANKLIFYDGINSDQTLANFQARVTPSDANSVTENPPFFNTTATPYNLHINPAIATALESGGTAVTTPIAITDDFDGDARGATPDIGADEFSGIQLPVKFNVTGGGIYCIGDAGLAVGLDNSQVGVTYTLYQDATPQTPDFAGTGSAISFGNQAGTHTYTVSATVSGKIVAMNGSAIVTAIVCTPTWSGLVNNEWNNAGNWIAGNIPASDGDAIIPAGCPNYPIITHSPMEVIHIGNLTVSGTGSKSVLTGGMAVSGELEVGGNLTITTTGSVDVTADGALTIDGNLLIVGSLLIESQGSMITNGSVSGSATIQRTIPTDMAWHFLSSPVSAQPICNGVFAPTYPGTFPGNIATWDFYNWLPGQCDANLHWRNLRTPTGGVNNVDFPLLAFADSRGYLVAYGSGWSPTKSFVGTPNTADRSLAFYDVTNSCSWALPGNPFPSAVDWSKVTLKENLVTPYYYIWNDVTQNYEWWGDGTHFGGVKIDGNIPAEQGFFVKILPSGTLHLNIPNSARVHDNGTDTWIKDAAANKLSLTIDNGTKYNDVSYVMFEDNCNVGVDRKDAEKMFSMNPAVPQIYTIINNDLKACSNSLPYVNNGTTIPVGFVAPVDGNYSITVGNMSSFSSLTGLSIEDLKLNINQDLLQNPVYTFTATGNEDAGRFLLHFAGAIGIDNKDNSPISIYSNEKTVFITCTAGFKNATVTISNLLGQEIVSQNLSDQKTNQVNVNVLKGYYIVKVQSDSSVKTAKVYIN